MGYKQALLTGEGMRRLGLQISAAYTSPSLRSVQTCAAILEGLGQEELAIRVEPGQYDFWGSDRNEPVFLSTEELVKAGVKIDLNYEPFMTVEELFSYKQETLTECYERVDRVTRNALNNTTGSILIVGHMSSIGMCTCMLEERQPIGDKDVPRFIGLMSYCGAAITRQNEDGSWALVDPQPLLPLTHSGNNTFDPIGLYTVIEQNGS
jgi:ubiquitin-associated SH3 domain-containing protein